MVIGVKHIIARQIFVFYIHIIVMCDSIIQWMAFSGPGLCMSAMNVDALVKPVRILSLLTTQGQNFKSIKHYKAYIISHEYGKFL